MPHHTDRPTGVYFSALLLRDLVGGKATALQAAFRDRWKLRISRGAIEGWLARDQIPGPVVAHMIVTDPAFAVETIIARRVQHVPAPVVEPAVADLLS